jgi:hypothetical protein
VAALDELTNERRSDRAGSARYEDPHVMPPVCDSNRRRNGREKCDSCQIFTRTESARYILSPGHTPYAS